jgi:transcriptional regulator with XRE-family HTH domain
MDKLQSFDQLYKAAEKDGSLNVESVKLQFAISLTKLMQSEGQSRSDLAKKIGKTNAYITKALRGDTNFTIGSMVMLVTAMRGKLDVVVSDVNGHEVKCVVSNTIEGNKPQDWKNARTNISQLSDQRNKLLGAPQKTSKIILSKNSQYTPKRDYANVTALIAA